MKKIIQIATESSVMPGISGGWAFFLTVLCDDGSIWQKSSFSGVEASEWTEIEPLPKERISDHIIKKLNIPIADLELSIRSANCLENAGIKYVGNLVRKSEKELLKIYNFGRKSLNEIKYIVTDMDLCLDSPFPLWLSPP